MSSFTFKQFHINQSQCAMKVGTDGILLGAWAETAGCRHILDMGTGTGLLALMLAQRSEPHCQIYAVELEPKAALQAQENIHASNWRERIFLFQQDIQDFTQHTNIQFDLIVANPPYFEQGVACKTDARDLARYAIQSHLDWLNWASGCLAKNGKISMVLPFDAAKTLIKLTALYCIKQTAIMTKAGKTPLRMLLTFSRENTDMIKDELVIYDENNQYTADFVALTKDFYLKM